MTSHIGPFAATVIGLGILATIAVADPETQIAAAIIGVLIVLCIPTDD